MNWDGVVEFISVVETESFTQAARDLACSTAHVSRKIGQLEERLNTKLFNRSTRKVSLTHEGSVYYSHCRSIKDSLYSAEEAISNLKAEPQGKIKLTAPTTYGSSNILPALNDFLLQYPKIKLDVNLTNRPIDLLEEGFDLAIRIGTLNDSSLVAKKLSTRTNYVCASPEYLKRNGHPKTIEELEHHNCLAGSLSYWRFLLDGKEVKQSISGSITYNDGYGLVDAAVKGIGIVQLPSDYLQPQLDSGELIAILEDIRVPDEPIWAVFHHNRQLSSKIRVLVDFLSQQLSST